MRSKYLILLVMTLLLMSTIAHVGAKEAAIEDWTQFGGSVAGTRCTNAASGPKSNNPSVKWEYAKDIKYCQTPIIVGDYALVNGSPAGIRCFDLKSGKLLWNAADYKNSSRKCADSANYYMFDGLVKMVCLDLKSGKQKWSKTITNAVGSQMICHNGMLYYGSTDGYFYCHSAKDGSQLWSFKSDDKIFGTPSIANNKLVFGTFKSISCLSLEKTPPEKALWTNTEVSEKYFSSPAIYDGKVYVVAGARKFTKKSQVCSFDLTSGKLLWKSEIPQVDISEVAVHQKYVVVGCVNGTAYCLDRTNGKSKWNFSASNQIECSPAIYGDNVLIGSDDGNFYSLNINSGKQNWKYETGTKYMDYAAIGRNKILLCGKKVVCLGD